ncbi:MAG: SGNH/GDSL hydrolase family protein [Candidatus Dadabacteria bacterium]|nr:MAG: SGNH/GDSL hydrolase family protein [Candidatus Dadabacteria bacterium]
MKKIGIGKVFLFFSVIAGFLIIPASIHSLSNGRSQAGVTLADINCDGKIKVVWTGDSIVRGVGDRKEKEGFVGRLRERVSNITVENLGVPGATTRSLLRAFKKNLLKKRRGTTKKRTEDADYIFILAGVNDFWERGPAARVERNLVRLLRFLKRTVPGISTNEVQPVVLVSTLLHTHREFQESFVNSVNALLLKSSRVKKGVLFHKLLNVSLNSDGLHPTARGYKRMSRFVLGYLREGIQKSSSYIRAIKDSDGDGVFDRCEKKVFHTDPFSR